MKKEFTVNVPGVGKVDVIRQYNLDDEGKKEYFWDLFLGEKCLDLPTFWTKPTKNDVLTLVKGTVLLAS